MSSKVYKLSISIDFAGINIYMIGGFIPAIYYGMYCYVDVAYFYLGIISIIGIIYFFLSLTDWFISSEYNTVRAVSYTAFSMFFFIPFGHLIIN
jgi:adiponectin receptor